MDKRTVSSAHERIDELQIQVAEIKTEMKIQFKDLYNRIKRLEAIMTGITTLAANDLYELGQWTQ